MICTRNSEEFFLLFLQFLVNLKSKKQNEHKELIRNIQTQCGTSVIFS